MVEKDIQESQRENVFHSWESNVNAKAGGDKVEKTLPTTGGGRVSPQELTSSLETLPKSFEYSHTFPSR